MSQIPHRSTFEGVARWAPGLRLVRNHGWHEFLKDAGAGVVLTGLLIPAGMGYAEVSGLPAVAGLLATVVALFAYALVGPSRVLIVGPDSTLSPIIAAAIAPLAVLGSERAVALAGLLAIEVGVILLIGGLLRLGHLMDLLSKPIRLGYLNGVAATLIVLQLPKLLGFSIDVYRLPGALKAFFAGIADGKVIGAAAVIGLVALVSILALRRVTPRLPGLLFAVIGATLLVWLLQPADVPVVGALPGGLPKPELQGLSWTDVGSLLPAALGIALVAFAETGVLARTFAARRRETPHDNHQMGAVGFTNLATGLLGGFPVSGSSSRTPVALESGARTQIAGVIGGLLVLSLILVAPGATAYLPSSAVAAVVIVAALSIADVAAVAKLRSTSPTEFALSMVAFAGVAILGVLPGIGVAVALAIAVFVLKASRPYAAELGRVDRRKGYHDVERHPEGRRIPGLVIARFDAPLFFANAAVFSLFIRRLVADAPEPVRWVVVAAEPITDVDSTAAEELVALDEFLQGEGVHLVFAELKGPVKERMVRLGLGGRFDAERLFPTLGTAVSAYLAATGTPWVDWTDLDDISGSASKKRWTKRVRAS
jgi:high affinity sulfate transporter 1